MLQMSVKHKDRKEEVEQFRIACTLAEMYIEYETADLVYELFKVHKKKKGKMNINDSVEIRVKHDEKWMRYYAKKKPESKVEFKDVEEPSETEKKIVNDTNAKRRV